jgi:molecular chaperone GrpE
MHDTENKQEPNTGEHEERHESLDAERVAELIAISRDEHADIPVGADDFVAALRIVADERDEHFARLQRTVADYQNFQRRASNNERDARQLAAAGVVQSVVNVVDYFDMAMQQNPQTTTVEQVIGGVQMIKSELIRVLTMHGVGVIDPASGAEFDPVRHEAIEQAESADVPPGRVVALRSPGYTIGDRVIRPAKVVVAKAVESEG